MARAGEEAGGGEMGRGRGRVWGGRRRLGQGQGVVWG